MIRVVLVDNEEMARERIIEAVESFSGGTPPSDDRSLVVVKFRPEG